MTEQPPLPEVPRELLPAEPREWITTRGEVKWLSYNGKAKCEDCLHLIIDHIGGRRFDRAPGLARTATTRRVQQEQEHLLCSEHKQIRIEKGEGP